MSSKLLPSPCRPLSNPLDMKLSRKMKKSHLQWYCWMLIVSGFRATADRLVIYQERKWRIDGSGFTIPLKLCTSSLDFWNPTKNTDTKCPWASIWKYTLSSPMHCHASYVFSNFVSRRMPPYVKPTWSWMHKMRKDEFFQDWKRCRCSPGCCGWCSRWFSSGSVCLRCSIMVIH